MRFATTLGIKCKQELLDRILLRNVMDSDHTKKALVSYLPAPFLPKIVRSRRSEVAHTNHLESLAIARSLDDLGFQVDIVSCRSKRPINYNDYDCIFGFGEPVSRYFAGKYKRILSILYCTGMHSYFQNRGTLKRLAVAEAETGRRLAGSVRYVTSDSSMALQLADEVVCIGDGRVAESYKMYAQRTPRVLPALYFDVPGCEGMPARRNINATRRNILFISGSGLLHKGLHLVLDAISRNQDFSVDVLANLAAEPEFTIAFSSLLNHPSVTIHGFVDLHGEKFRSVLESCLFVVSASCSEGGAAAVVNAIANGGCIPLVSPESGIPTEHFGLNFHPDNRDDFDCTLDRIRRSSESELRSQSIAAQHYFQKNNTASRFQGLLTTYIGNHIK